MFDPSSTPRWRQPKREVLITGDPTGAAESTSDRFEPLAVKLEGLPLLVSPIQSCVFVGSVNDATVRAVNYARSLGAQETRAIYFDLDPDAAHRIEEQWFDARLGIPLDVVEAPFRDLTGPMLEEVRRFTSRPKTVVNVVIPEFIVRKRRHLLLHNQNALFVKRLFLFEERALLTSVPYPLEATDAPLR